VKKIDRIFTPRGLNPDDAKVLFHPIDYVVFNGMKDNNMIRDIVLLDRERRDMLSRRLQRSIEKTIESGNYEWRTISIDERGEIRSK
jgi:predicted Holliday junction resolvase-like endonuclease